MLTTDHSKDTPEKSKTSENIQINTKKIEISHKRKKRFFVILSIHEL